MQILAKDFGSLSQTALTDLQSILDAGDALRSAGELDAADDILSRGLERFPEAFWIAVQIAWVAVARQDWTDALKRWDFVSDRFPPSSVTSVGRGAALRELGRLEESDQILGDAVVAFPEDPMPFIHHAWTAARKPDAKQALTRWELGKARFPDNEYIAAGEVESLLDLDRVGDARIAVNRALKLLTDNARITALDEKVRRFELALAAPDKWVAEEIRSRGIDRALPMRQANPEVLIEITSICNFACTYCVSPMKLREKKQMSMETFRKVVAEVAPLTTKPIGLHIDGEPTSHPNFREMALLVNSYGLPISLATNGSHLDPAFLDIKMDPLISMSTMPEELAKRHSKLKFDSYIERIVQYVRAWANSNAEQNVFFQIVHYPQATPDAWQDYKKKKDVFLVEFSKRAGLYESCIEEESIDSDFYRFRRKNSPRILTFIKQNLTMGGLYPVDGELVERKRATAGFCDSPWRMLVVHSNGTLGACCSDLSGGTTFASAEDVQRTSIKDQWENSPRIRQIRDSFLEGRVELDVCQRCIEHKQIFFAERDDQPSKS